MSELTELVAQVNEEYLIGLSNKGIVKRAQKDKEETVITFLSEEGCIKVGEETVTIKNPLGDSECSCPSRSICRHVVLGILAWQEELGKTTEVPVKSGETPEESSETPAKSAETPEKSGDTETNIRVASDEKTETDADTPTSVGTAGVTLQEKVLHEIEAFPLEQLKKVLKKKYISFLNEIDNEEYPSIKYSSSITVELIKEKETVSLLSPLEYSTCTCHKKEMCVHKAQAICWCKYLNQMVSMEALQENPESRTITDTGQRRTVAGEIIDALQELLETGLSRTSTDTMVAIERLAVKAHEVELPEYEGDLRAVLSEYEKYTKRTASFRPMVLLQRILRLYVRSNRLKDATDEKTIILLAGTFRAAYAQERDLTLSGVASEAFTAPNGYEGETVYLQDVEEDAWYTYTVTRPVFYENKRKISYKKQMAPWGLQQTMEVLPQMSLQLHHARYDERNRLSSTKDCKADILSIGSFRVTKENPSYFDDFKALFERRIQNKNDWLLKEGIAKENPVFIKPATMEKAYFSKTKQTLYMRLTDASGREMLLDFPYRKDRDWEMHKIERLNTKDIPCFFGRVFLQEGRLHFFPIAILRDEEKVQPPNGQGEMGATNEVVPSEASHKDMTENTIADFTYLLQFLEQMQELMEDVFQSGFKAVPEVLIKQLKEEAGYALQYGLTDLGEKADRLCALLEKRRHSMKTEGEEKTQCTENAVQICRYLYLAIEKTKYDMAKIYYGGEK